MAGRRAAAARAAVARVGARHDGLLADARDPVGIHRARASAAREQLCVVVQLDTAVRHPGGVSHAGVVLSDGGGGLLLALVHGCDGDQAGGLARGVAAAAGQQHVDGRRQRRRREGGRRALALADTRQIIVVVVVAQAGRGGHVLQRAVVEAHVVLPRHEAAVGRAVQRVPVAAEADVKVDAERSGRQRARRLRGDRAQTLRFARGCARLAQKRVHGRRRGGRRCARAGVRPLRARLAGRVPVVKVPRTKPSGGRVVGGGAEARRRVGGQPHCLEVVRGQPLGVVKGLAVRLG